MIVIIWASKKTTYSNHDQMNLVLCASNYALQYFVLLNYILDCVSML